jgi:para-nitrobenzyl esterase
MRSTIIVAVAILASSMSIPVAFANPPASAAASKMTTAATPLGDLLDNPASKAVLVKYAPVLTQGGQIDQARPMTLKALQAYMPDLNDDLLGKIDADLAQLK